MQFKPMLIKDQMYLKKEKQKKNTSMWKLVHMLLKHQWVNEENKEGIRRYLMIKVNGNTTHKNYGMQQNWF